MADTKKTEPKTILVDAAHTVVGRLGSYVAKQALAGVHVNIINCEQAIITGKKIWILPHFSRIRDERGQIRHGPYMHRGPDKFVRRTIRGMLPWDKTRGQNAWRRIMCYTGTPAPFKNQKAEAVPRAHVTKLTNLNYITIGQLCKHLGAKL